MKGRRWNLGLGGYRYGFNGKGNDNEIKGEGNQQDYGMRVYDGRVGRFLSIDPLSQGYPFYTPYQFAGNTPIQAVDLDGAEEELVQLRSAQRRKALMQMDNAWTVQQRQNKVQTSQPNWGAKWKAWNDSKSPTHTWALFSRLGYAIVNDATIAYTTAVHGKNHALGIDNGGVTGYKERVGAGLNTLANIALPVIGAELKGTKAASSRLATQEEASVGNNLAKPPSTIAPSVVSDKGYSTLAELGLKDGMEVPSSKILEYGESFLGEGYTEPVHGSGRYVSADGKRVFRIGTSDITGAHGGGPHANFETLVPNPAKPGRVKVDQNFHIYIKD